MTAPPAATPRSCLIVGAGISGLLAARELRQAGVEVTILDKGRGVGGRMATRRVGDAVFDHGAQFFTVRGERFGSLVQGWLRDGSAEEWSRGFPSPRQNAPDGHPRYRGSKGMTSIPKSLAKGLEVHTGERVERLEQKDEGWLLTTDSQEEYSAESLILTPPAPQSLALAHSGSFRLAEADFESLSRLSYDPCLALMAQLRGESPVPEPGGLQIKSEPLDWISDNSRKGISEVPALTIHAGPGYSREHYDDPPEEIEQDLLRLAGQALGEGFADRVSQTSLRRWRYSWVTSPHPEPCLAAESPAPMIFAGDGFGQPKIEGAAISGLAAADTLLDRA